MFYACFHTEGCINMQHRNIHPMITHSPTLKQGDYFCCKHILFKYFLIIRCLQEPNKATGWLYVECHFAFGWLDGSLSWIGFADEGTGEARRGAAPSLCSISWTETALHFNMQHLCRESRPKWLLLGGWLWSLLKLRVGAFGTARFCTDVSIHNVTLSFASVPREVYFKGGYSVFSSLVLLDHFICYCQWKASAKTCSTELGLLCLIMSVWRRIL